MAYIHQINNFDIDNDFGQGPVVSVFFNFCPFHCKNCWNESTWKRQEDLYWDNQKAANTIINALNKLKDRHMKPNLSLLGGDPLVDENIDDTLAIIKRIKKKFQKSLFVHGQVLTSKTGGVKMSTPNKKIVYHNLISLSMDASSTNSKQKIKCLALSINGLLKQKNLSKPFKPIPFQKPFKNLLPILIQNLLFLIRQVIPQHLMTSWTPIKTQTTVAVPIN